jgi:hypothetical protein
MIDDLDETIHQLLIAEMPVKNGEVEISFEQPRRENTSRWNRPTVNLFLYDLRENHILRQHAWERLPDGNGHPNQARLKRTPLRVDCAYMITTWAAVPEDEHRLLARCLLALFRFPTLPADRLVGSLSNPPFDIQARLASHDKLTNPAEVWSAMDNEIRPTVSYVITLALDPWQEISGPLVRTLNLQTGQAAGLPQQTGFVDSTLTELMWVGGTVRNRARAGTGLEGVKIVIKESGHTTTTDRQGRFTLGSLSPGEYTLVAYPPTGKATEKEIVIPAQGEAMDREKVANYDLEL